MTHNVVAALWFILSLFISVCNDAVVKTLNDIMSPLEIAFLRNAIGTVFLLPFIIFNISNKIKTSKIHIHIARGIILAAATSLWNYGIGIVPIATITLMSFTIPIFTVIMAAIFLHEEISNKIIIATCIGFIGSIISLSSVNTSFSLLSIIFVVASILFATLDIVNKKMLNRGERALPMLFYSNLFTTLVLTFNIPNINYEAAIEHWEKIVALGIGTNLILYCILKAFSLAKASFLAPVRYFELIISATVGYMFFNESITTHTIIGGFMVISALTIINTKSKQCLKMKKGIIQ